MNGRLQVGGLFLTSSLVFLFGVLAISTTNAQDWAWQQTIVPSGSPINSLAFNSQSDVFAGTIDSGVFRSTDNCESWTQINNGLTGTAIQGLAINSSDEIFAVTSDGVFRSTDNGENWTPTNSSPDGIHSPIVNSAGDILASFYHRRRPRSIGGVYRSIDNGDTWFIIYSIESDFIVDKSINSVGDIFLALGRGDIMRSIDNGGNWTSLGVGQTVSLAFNSVDDIFAGTEGYGVWRSTDNGDNWTEINNGLTQRNIRSLIVNQANHAFAGTEGHGVFLSTDSGENWTQINNGLTDTSDTFVVWDLAINSNGDVFAVINDGDLYRMMNPTDISNESNDELMPIDYHVSQNYPNPFNPSTTIEYYLPTRSLVDLTVHNLLGQKIVTLVNQTQPHGPQTATWNGKDSRGNPVASGVYLYRIKADGFIESRKMVLLK